ncbi:hypothetical protein EVAR_30479_1 [Eumeta japonica]|uniref:Secreted protein n=1 Tax=Eumeta variegata TaxID=151549 RepID=A0A4C1VYX5_EUMVA|nr:hypothetical protein EVAR_30479_1 [Eumeta japonica]
MRIAIVLLFFSRGLAAKASTLAQWELEVAERFIVINAITMSATDGLMCSPRHGASGLHRLKLQIHWSICP